MTLFAKMTLICTACLVGCNSDVSQPAHSFVKIGKDNVYHVYPGQSIQAAIESAAVDPVNKTVRVHAGVYRPQFSGQALVYFNRNHDAVVLEAEGEVILTAANDVIADKSEPSYPAVVNHVVYMGDGISDRTVLRGFRIEGANNFVTRSMAGNAIEPSTLLDKGLFFYADGGAIKIFGRSYPTIVDVEISNNYVSPCGGGISVEHQGFNEHHVTIKNCVFANNRCQITGAAVDVLPGSAATITNCLFVGNVANMGPNYIGGSDNPYNEEHGSGALTVFPGSRVTVDRCTFTDNWNGADDKGDGCVYLNSVFWRNVRSGGISPKGRYELDILDGRNVSGCFFGGEICDLRGSIDPKKNRLDAPDPNFDLSYRPRTPDYVHAGYRPDAE